MPASAVLPSASQMDNSKTIDLKRHKVRVIIGPYNTICKAGDVWKVKQMLDEMVKSTKKKCPTCNQEIRNDRH